MMKKLLYAFCMIMIIFQSCKTKTHMMEECVSDSIASSIAIDNIDENYIIDIELPCNNLMYNDSVCLLDSIVMLQPLKISPKLKLSPILNAGGKIHIEKRTRQSKSNDTKSSLKRISEEKKEMVSKQKVSQNVIFAIVIAIFICLIVRLAKKVRK